MYIYYEFLDYLNKELKEWKDLESYSISKYGRYEIFTILTFGVDLKFKNGSYYFFKVKFHYKNELGKWITPTLEELKINVLSEINRIKKHRKNLKSKLQTLNREIDKIKKELGE